MTILSTEATQSILNDDMVLTIIGALITGLLALVLRMGWYIWKDRKKQLDLTAKQQADLNEMFMEETNSIKDSHASIAKSNAELSATMKGLSKFIQTETHQIKKVNDKQDEKIIDHERRISQIEGALS